MTPDFYFAQINQNRLEFSHSAMAVGDLLQDRGDADRMQFAITISTETRRPVEQSICHCTSDRPGGVFHRGIHERKCKAMEYVVEGDVQITSFVLDYKLTTQYYYYVSSIKQYQIQLRCDKRLSGGY
ncbi:unnamed protein product [Calicophoron daubneyi]|uniref:ZP domain-containing protein n=1 Tax=Calicophoron daubneyi TaxID=300641 RepID=A0AAV2TDI1_CALDB